VKDKDIEDLLAGPLNDFRQFVEYVAPHLMLGKVHYEVMDWMTQSVLDWSTGELDGFTNKFLILSREHLKSTLMGLFCTWLIVRDPTITILYGSETYTIAKQQVRAVKQWLCTEAVNDLCPGLVHPEEGKRTLWREDEFIVDHPLRKESMIRDCTVKAIGVGAKVTGLHSSIILYDDLVSQDNAYTQVGRDAVAQFHSFGNSLLNSGGMIFGAGTYYHPDDQYHKFKTELEEVVDDEGEVIDERPTWEFFERIVEKDGVYAWPRVQCPKTGKWYGFNQKVLNRKKAGYKASGNLDKFYSQYYNDPNSMGSHRLSRDKFQYYEQAFIKVLSGAVHFKQKKLSVFAGMDFASSTSKRADYTAVTVIGIDEDGFIYILDMERIKTSKIEDYYQLLFQMHERYPFRKIRVEANSNQKAFAEYLKDRVREEGLSLIIDAHATSKADGTKEERIAATLEPRYENNTILHFKGGLTPALEEELILARPVHDDLKDSLAMACAIAKAPSKRQTLNNVIPLKQTSRFGSRRGR
jgi:predicted phage terminase large subunit-like protein